MTKDHMELTRQQLYELVWSRPLRELSDTLPLSDVGIAKVCKRYNIPRPPQGNWIKLKHGYCVPKPPLPKATSGMSTTFTLKVKKAAEPTHSQVRPIDVPLVSPGAKSHRVIVQCRAAFKRATVDDYGRLATPRNDVNVSRQLLTRALGLLNQMLLTLERLQYYVDYCDQKKGFVVTREGESLYLSLFEPANRTQHQLTAKELADQQRRSWAWAPRWDYTPSGMLTFSLSGRGLYGTQTQWKDGKSRTLENRLPDIIRCIVNATSHQQSARERDRQRAIRAARDYQVRQRQSRIQQLTVQRQEAVDALINDWEKSKRIAAFIDELEQHTTIETLPPTTRRPDDWSDGQNS